MKQELKFWQVIDIYNSRNMIQYPEYQREPSIWDSEKKARLIDSILSGIPIPLIFLYEQKNGTYDCVDGQQRIRSIVEFFSGELELKGYGHIDDIRENPELIDKLEKSILPIVIIKDADDSELRELFRRLQLGTPLNAGEKLHSLTGDMRDFVFNTARSHPFIKAVSIPERRYAKEQVLAQICINSFSISKKREYQSARYDKLRLFFEMYDKLDKYTGEIKLIKHTLDLLHKSFGEKANILTNRALILTAYLSVEDLVRKDKESKVKDFARFYFKFVETLKVQVGKGLDYDKKYRELLEFYKSVNFAAFEPYQIRNRSRVISEYFAYWEANKKIKLSSA